MIAAEQKARTTYDNILRLVKDEPDVYEPIKFLRAREIVHFQRFGEANRKDCGKNCCFLSPVRFLTLYIFQKYVSDLCGTFSIIRNYIF